MEKSIFLQTFGDTPILRVLDFLIIHDEFDYSMVDIAQQAGTGYSTLKQFFNQLEKQKILIMTRRIGKAKLYQLNKQNQAVKKFKELYWTITKQKTNKLLKSNSIIHRKIVHKLS